MTDSRENLGWLLGSIVTALGLIFGWILQSGVLNTLVGVAIGAGITYYVQTKTQNRAWKREYTIKIVEEVYGNLFKQVKTIIQSLEEKYYTYWISFDKWKEFQQDHRYFMVDDNFRVKLDDFDERLDKYSRSAIKLNDVIRKIVIEETERVFGEKINQIPQVEVRYMKGYSQSSTMPDLIRCLASETHPIEIPKRNESDVTGLELTLIITSIDNKTSKIPYSLNKNLEKFWQSCIKRMKENETYRFVVEENSKILEDARKLREEIVKRIEEPWKI
jgi:hypothetical protein